MRLALPLRNSGAVLADRGAKLPRPLVLAARPIPTVLETTYLQVKSLAVLRLRLLLPQGLAAREVLETKAMHRAALMATSIAATRGGLVKTVTPIRRAVQLVRPTPTLAAAVAAAAAMVLAVRGAEAATAEMAALSIRTAFPVTTVLVPYR
jgi:hypothetical protein